MAITLEDLKKQKVYILFSMRLIINMSMKSVYHIFWFWVPLSYAGFLGIFFFWVNFWAHVDFIFLADFKYISLPYFPPLLEILFYCYFCFFFFLPCFPILLENFMWIIGCFACNGF